MRCSINRDEVVYEVLYEIGTETVSDVSDRYGTDAVITPSPPINAGPNLTRRTFHYDEAGGPSNVSSSAKRRVSSIVPSSSRTPNVVSALIFYRNECL